MICWVRLSVVMVAAAGLCWADELTMVSKGLENAANLPTLRLKTPHPPAEIDAARIIRDAANTFRAIEESFDDELDQMVQSRVWPPRRLKLMKERVIADIDATLQTVEAALAAHQPSPPGDDARHLANLHTERDKCLKRIDLMAHSAVGRLAYMTGVIH